VDISVLNDDGNLFDACGLAAMAAINSAKFPKVDSAGKVDYHELTKKKVPIKKAPLGVTVIKIGSHLIVDPTANEMKALDARLTVCSTEDGKLCALQKGGSGTLSADEAVKMIALGVEKSADLRKLLP
jgi:exosome complex component RRP42